MKTISFLSGAVLVLFCAAFSRARADDQLGDRLGTVRFEVSGQPVAQQHVVRGVKLLHHMMYPEADREFALALEADPDCALAWWGRAMTLIHPLWPDIPSDADRRAGESLLQKGLAIGSATPRERAYLEALDTFFAPAQPPDYPTGLKTLDVALGRVADQYPQDTEALAFSALYHLAPIRFQAKDPANRAQLQAAHWLQAIVAQIPDHPGAEHYLIHAYDFPALAGQALEVCAAYGALAPDVPHALHMPTHIYTRRGLWDKSIEFNLRSAAAARKLDARNGTVSGHFMHASDYLVYAYLQTGQFRRATAIRTELALLNGPFTQAQPTALAFSFAAIPARCTLERQAWTEAAALPIHDPAAYPWSPKFIYCDSITRYARAIGAARSGQLERARAEIAELDRIHGELAAMKLPPYWNVQAEVQALAARAWVLHAERKDDEAVAALRHAAELELATDKEAVTPGEVLPAGDLLGDLLLELNRPADALTAYESVLAAAPNRLNTLYGAGLAAEKCDALAKARSYFAQLAASATNADAGIERVQHARDFLANQRVAANE